MKKLFISLCLVLLTVIPASAVDINFAWDPSDGAIFYTLFEINPLGIEAVVADNIPATNVLVVYSDTAKGRYQFYVTASNAIGMSNPSNLVATYLGVPGTPQNLSITGLIADTKHDLRNSIKKLKSKKHITRK